MRNLPVLSQKGRPTAKLPDLSFVALFAGALFTLAVGITNSLWPAIVMHALIDFGAGIMVWLALRHGPDDGEEEKLESQTASDVQVNAVLAETGAAPDSPP